MNNYKIVIDAGHGGEDSGATGNGIIEKNLTLNISKYIYDRLRNLGVPVTMTRTTDETISPTERVNRILNAYGDNNDVIVVSNHINAGGGDGAEVIYALRNDDKLANLVLDNLEKAGQNPRKVYQRRLPSNMSKDYYFIHRNTGKTEPIIVEYGFLDGKGNDVNLLKNNYQQLAEATVQALLEYIGYNSNINENTYTVKSGDSLWSIAKKFNTTLQDLKQLNNLSSNLLNVGQILQIPESSPVQNEYILYTVKNGDTLYSISRNFNTTPQELRIINDLGSNFLSIGQQLKVPNNSLNDENENNFIEYTVKSGDTLYSISRNYNIDIQDLMKINNLSSNLLSVGQILQIPSEQVNTTYVVKNGDTLYSIASQFNTTVDNLKQKNNLTNNIISIGQVLNI